MNALGTLSSWVARTDLEHPVSLSAPLLRQGVGPRAYGLSALRLEASRVGDWVGQRHAGASVNCDDAQLSIHSASTHTECVAHVSDIPLTIADVAPLTLLRACILSIPLQARGGDYLITASALEDALRALAPLTFDALILRTFDDPERAASDWTGTNPPYFDRDAMSVLVRRGILHLITDLPSVDREDDGGLLAAHRAFFGLWPKSNDDTRPTRATITELAFIPASLPDGLGVLRLDTLPWPSDAAPSRPVFFPLLHA